MKSGAYSTEIFDDLSVHERDTRWSYMLRASSGTTAVDGEHGALTSFYDNYQHLAAKTLQAMVDGGLMAAEELDEDAYATATLALLESIRSWDPDSDTSFARYAHRSIRRAVIGNYATESLVGGVGNRHHRLRAKMQSWH